jgi:multisubunit Na+/H+ antiporter MnhF subunit
MAFDLLASIVTCAVLVAAAGSGDGILLDLAVMLGLIGFLTSVTVARYIESRPEDRS